MLISRSVSVRPVQLALLAGFLAVGVGCSGGGGESSSPPMTSPPPSRETLLERAAAFPAMPRDITELVAVSPSATGSFGSGLPFSDLEYTIYDTDYMEGETNGFDTFMPVDPSEAFPGTDTIKLVRGTNNVDLDFNYDGSDGDRVILGTAEIDVPFFSIGPDGEDNDYAVLSNFDYTSGFIQLRGTAGDYELVRCEPGDGCATEGYFLFYTAGAEPDLIAFVFECDDLADTISGNPTQNTKALCNSTGELDLADTNQFRFAAPINNSQALVRPGFQFGGAGKDIVGGLALDETGDIYVFGMSDSNLDGGASAENEVFIAKYDPLGNTLWVTEIDLPNGSLIWDAVADNDFLYAAGRTLGALDGFTNAGRWDAILLKLDRDTGEIVATDQFGNPSLDGYGNIVLDDDGNVFVSAQGSLPGDSGTNPRHLIAKHRTSDLSNVWREFVEPDAGVVIVSEAWGGLSYVPGAAPGDGTLVAGGWYFTNGGSNAWMEAWSDLTSPTPTRSNTDVIASAGVEADWVLDNAVGADGSIYAVGFTTGDLDGANLGKGDAYIVKYEPDLSNPQFVQVGTAFDDAFRKMVIGPDGVIYALGYSFGDYAGLNADSTNGTADVIIQAFDADLNLLGAEQFGTQGEDRGYLRLFDDRLFIGGMTEMGMTGANRGSFDGYIAEIPSSEF